MRFSIKYDGNSNKTFLHPYNDKSRDTFTIANTMDLIHRSDKIRACTLIHVIESNVKSNLRNFCSSSLSIFHSYHLSIHLPIVRTMKLCGG